MEQLPLNIFSVDTPDGIKDYVSCLPHELVFARGLVGEAIMGVLLQPLDRQERITPDVFAPNRVFVDFMHDVVARRGPEQPGLVAEAQRQGDGWVYVIDQRTPTPGGAVPPEDIVGWFEVRGGRVVAGSYKPCPKHVVLTDDGFFNLGPELQACLLEELENRLSPAAHAGKLIVLDIEPQPQINAELDYIWIPPGNFQMGFVPGDEVYDQEKPRHRVEITKAFWMSSTAVTVAAYKRFVEATSHQIPKAPRFNPNWEKDDHPIVRVNWHDAEAYCEWAGGRLPTEAEWEYAARGGKEDLIYPWGNELSSQNAKYDSRDGTAPVGSYPANGFGLYDMTGNVWEWVADWYEENYYVSSPARDPEGPSAGRGRVLRGGAWDIVPVYLRASYRCGVGPVSWWNDIGFRCAREVFP